MNLEFKQIVKYAILGIVILVIFIAVCQWINPIYKVWEQRKHGEAELARAESNRQIAILEAKAKEESSKALAQAEVIRAHGVAEANKIIGDSLKSNESYLRYLWIQGLQTNHVQTIYVPTEAGLPILEASRVPLDQMREIK